MSHQPQAPAVLTENRLLIEFLFKTHSRQWLRKCPYPIQGDVFDFGVKVKNVGDNHFLGATIKRFKIKHASTPMEHTSKVESRIPALNPGESTSVWFDHAICDFDGLVWLSCYVVPVDASYVIKTFQKFKEHEKLHEYDSPNQWGNSAYIQKKLELLQARTNYLILMLTVVTFLQGAFGLKEIGKFISSIGASVFGAIAGIFRSMS